MYVFFSCFLWKVLFRSLFWGDLSAMSVDTNKPAFYSILAKLPNYVCNARVFTKLHSLYARHALLQNMALWALLRCLCLRNIHKENKTYCSKFPIKSFDFSLAKQIFAMKFLKFSNEISVFKDLKCVLSHIMSSYH